MVQKLHVALLGRPEVLRGGEPAGAGFLNKAQALLYYLATTGTAHSRTALAGLLWSDMAEAEARANLRMALSQLNRALPDQLAITRQTIEFNLTSDYWLDLDPFRAAYRSLPENGASEQAHEALKAAVALYRGEFLDDFHLRGAPLFEPWVLAQRDQFQQMAVEMLSALVARATAHKAYAVGLGYARRILGLEPALEAAHRQAMSLLAYTGERTAALAQYETCRKRLKEELSLEPAPETTALYERIRSGDLNAPGPDPVISTTTLPRNAPPAPTPNNLPLHLTSFVGREPEIAEVKRLLSGQRLLTLTGIGGAGKTRLALEVGTSLLDAFTDGVWLVALAPLTDPALVAWEAASAMGIREVPGETILTTLIESLRAKRVLLILDNCEHLLDACARLTEALLQACPGVRILATSRENLDLPGEGTFSLPPLALPELHEQAPVEAVRQYEAVRLFSERAAVVQPAFRVTEQNADLVVQVCRRLDGLPLAIELAAARAKLLSLEQIVARLEDRFQLLTDGGRTAMPRQQTLRASIDWSYDLLSPTELEFFGGLSVFAGGWTLESAEALWAGQSDTALDLLTRLVDKSLVVAVRGAGERGTADRGGSQETRYRLLETIRQYAAEKLNATHRAETLRRLHLTIFLAMAETAEPELDGADQALALPRLERELDNMRAALDWALGKGLGEEGLRLAASLRQFWYLTNHLHEGRSWIDKFLNLPGATISPATRGKALHAAGYSALLQDDNAAAAQWLEASLEILRQLNDTRQATHVLIHLAGVRLALGGTELAQSNYEQSLRVMRDLDDKHGIMDALWGLGVIAYNQNNYDPAQEYCTEGLGIARQLHDLERQAWFLRDVGRIALARGDLGVAQPSFEQALAVSRQIGSQQLTAFALVMLGKLRLAEHDTAQAEALLDEALQHFRAFGEKYGVTTVLTYLGQAASLQGQVTLAVERYRESLKLLVEMGSQAHAAPAVEGLAGVAVTQGQMAKAARWFGAANAMRERVHTPLAPADRPDYERSLAAVKAGLYEDEFAASWQAGSQMTLEQLMSDLIG